ncbi:hypothetical protein, partial [Salmonella sp. s58078]|uniref:hypothetical protein n=1 Tax=Salmonella sp. s58078 TaxID=3159699 RepID=UPI00397FA1AE
LAMLEAALEAAEEAELAWLLTLLAMEEALLSAEDAAELPDADTRLEALERADEIALSADEEMEEPALAAELMIEETALETWEAELLESTEVED